MMSRSIAMRLTVMVSVLLLSIILVGTMGLKGIMEVEDGLETVYHDRVVPLRDLKVISDMYAVNLVDTTHKVRDGSLSWAEALKNFDAAKATIAQKWQAYLSTYLIEEEKKTNR